MTTTRTERRHIPARDGYPLAATVVGSGPRIAVVNSATAVPRGFYQAYAEALANDGFTVITYDYRGIGESRPKRLRGFRASASDWVLLDMAAVVDFAADKLGADRVLLVGHSISGQLAGLLDNADRVGGLLTFSAQSGYWRYQGRGQRLPVALHTQITLPLFAHTFGYVPWSRFAAAEDLPREVAIQWSRWCRNPRYVLGDPSLPLHRYATFPAPVLAYSIEDDPWGTARSVDVMMSAYPTVERRHLQPAAHGLTRLGHFGFVRRSSATFWPETFTWLAARAEE